MLRGKVEGEMVQLSEDSSVKESPEDKQVSAPCIRGSAKCHSGTLHHLITFNSFQCEMTRNRSYTRINNFLPYL